MRRLFILLMLVPFMETLAQQPGSQGECKIEGDKDVYMLTYFRQRYPTRIEIDSNGNIIEVPLPDPMQVEKLHMALSTDGRH